MSIADMRKALEQRRQQSEQARRQAEETKKKIPKTSQKQLRIERTGLAGRQFQRDLAGQRTAVEGRFQEISKFDTETQQAEKEIEDYLRTPSGMRQWASENGVQGEPIYDRVVKGGSIELVGYKVSTPYGSYIDYSPRDELLKDMAKLDKLENEKIYEMGYTSPTAYYKAEALKQIEEFKGQLPAGENVLVKYKGGIPYISGVESNVLGQSIATVPDYVREFNKKISSYSTSTDTDPRTGKPYGTLTEYKPAETNSTLQRWQNQLSQTRSNILSDRTRGQSTRTQSAQLWGLGIASSVLGNIQFVKDIVTTNPKTTVSNLWTGAKTFTKRAVSGEGFPEVSAMIMNEPEYVGGYAVGEYITGKGLTSATDFLSNKASLFFTKIDPRYVSVSDDGKILKYGTNWIDDTTEIKLLSSADDITTPLAVQTRLAGTTQDVVSAQRNLFGFFDDSRLVSKPLPNMEKLSETTKKLLKQFDEGTLPYNKLDDLNARIIKETGGKGLLERSFFADPLGRVRTSRLFPQDTRKASLFDIYSGDFTLTKNKPQVLVFKGVVIEDLPYYLSDIKQKLLNKIALTTDEASRLRTWQLQRSGQFKPIGFLTPEPETTLATGELIYKSSTPAVTIIDGKRVKIIEATVGSSTSQIDQLIARRNTVGLTVEETNKLNRLLEKQTGLSYAPSSSPYLSPANLGSSSGVIGGKFISSGIAVSPSSSNIMISVPESYQPISQPKKSKDYFGIPSSPAPRVTKTFSPMSPTSKISKTSMGIFSGKPKQPKYSPPKISTPKYPTPTPKKPPISSPPKRRTEVFQRIAKEIEDEGFFEVFSKRFGRDIKVGKSKTKKGAEDILQRYLGKTLGAGGFITKDGSKLLAKDLGLSKNPEYRLSRGKNADPFKIIQKAKYRLKKRDTQVAEIEYFKKKNPKRNNTKKKSSWLDWFS